MYSQVVLTASGSAAVLGRNMETLAVIPDGLPLSFYEAFRCLGEWDMVLWEENGMSAFEA